MNNMLRLILCLGLAAWMTGCVSKSHADAQARAAYFAGQAQAQARALDMQQSQAAKPQEPSVWVVGNVRNAYIPWSQDLTLIKAIIAADYLGAGDPGQITVLRNGQQPVMVSPRQLLSGQDMPLAVGDRIEIRP